MSKKGHNSMDGKQLLSIVNRIEKLDEEKAAISDDVKAVYAEAKGNGFENKIIRKVIKLRKMDAADREEQKALLEVYCRALGLEALE